jgi:hypothetical protein
VLNVQVSTTSVEPINLALMNALSVPKNEPFRELLAQTVRSERAAGVDRVFGVAQHDGCNDDCSRVRGQTQWRWLPLPLPGPLTRQAARRSQSKPEPT